MSPSPTGRPTLLVVDDIPDNLTFISGLLKEQYRVKVANHGVGQVLHPEQDERVVTSSDIAQLRAFLATTLPALADAPLVATRRCLYVDTPDGDFWIDRHPDYVGLTVATGDSGHGFKFAPILGELIADAIEGKPNHWLARFRWRDFSAHEMTFARR